MNVIWIQLLTIAVFHLLASCTPSQPPNPNQELNPQNKSTGSNDSFGQRVSKIETGHPRYWDMDRIDEAWMERLRQALASDDKRQLESLFDNPPNPYFFINGGKILVENSMPGSRIQADFLKSTREHGQESFAHLIERSLAVASIVERARRQGKKISLSTRNVPLSEKDVAQLEVFADEVAEIGASSEPYSDAQPRDGWSLIEVALVIGEGPEVKIIVRDNASLMAGSTWHVFFRRTEDGYYESSGSTVLEH